MESDPNKPNPGDGWPYDVISSNGISEITRMFASRGGGYLVIGNISESISACSKANGGAFVNESTAGVTDVPLYYCGGFKSQDEVDAMVKQYKELPQNWTDGPPAYFLAQAGVMSAAVSQHLGAWWWIPFVGSVVLGFISI